MIPLSKFLRLAVISRQLHSSRPLTATITKKSFADLPTGHVLPDGSYAEPLGEWREGPECSPLRCAPLHVLQVQPGLDVTSVASDIPLRKTRTYTKRVKGTDSLQSGSEQPLEINSQHIKMEPRRGRKPKGSPNEIGGAQSSCHPDFSDPVQR